MLKVIAQYNGLYLVIEDGPIEPQQTRCLIVNLVDDEIDGPILLFSVTARDPYYDEPDPGDPGNAKAIIKALAFMKKQGLTSRDLKMRTEKSVI